MAGPLTAVFLRILSESVLGRDIVLSFIYPIVVSILPNVLSILEQERQQLSVELS
ncbi:MAG: hypothetical protein QW196_06550 [Sulfolobales archaeon]